MLFDWNSPLSNEEFSTKVAEMVEQFGLQLSASERLKLLFDLENKLYEQAGKASIAYNGGVHTKHRHINYHQFFIERVAPNSKVLDIGCGNGALTFDVANQVSGVNIIGIDLNPENIAYASKNFSHRQVQYVCGDVLKDLPHVEVDCIIMSNVLEHLPDRAQFLQQLIKLYAPKTLLLRVPTFERDWRVPLKEELGIDYRLDKTHFIEYKKGEFESEVAVAGLVIKEQIINWGEIWAVCVPISS